MKIGKTRGAGPPEGLPGPPEGPPGPPEGVPSSSRAQARDKVRAPAGPKLGPKLGPGQISGNLEIWNLDIWKFWILKIDKKNLKIQIRSAQTVGNVWISRKNNSWPCWGPCQANFSMDRKHAKIEENLPISLGGPMGPIHQIYLLVKTARVKTQQWLPRMSHHS